MATKHINDDGEMLTCTTTPDKCDYSRNGDHLPQNATDMEIVAFHRQAEKVAERAAGEQSAVGTGSKRKVKTEEQEDRQNEERARASREEYLNDKDSQLTADELVQKAASQQNPPSPSALTETDSTYLNPSNTYAVVDADTEQTDAYMGAKGFVGSNAVSGYRRPKEIASDMREDYKQAKKDGALPKDARIGIRSGTAGTSSSIDVRVENLDEQDVYQYGYAKGNNYAVANRDLSRPALDLYQKQKGPGTVADNVDRVHDSYNYSDSNAQFDYFSRGYYGSTKLGTKFEYSRDQLERAKKGEAKAASEYGYGSDEWQAASVKRIEAEDKVKEAAYDRSNRVNAYRKQHVLDTTAEGTPERAQGDFKNAMAAHGPFAESNVMLNPMVQNKRGDFQQDEVSFNHKPFGPSGMDKVEEAPHGRPVRYPSPFDGRIHAHVEFLDGNRVRVSRNDESEPAVETTPAQAAETVRGIFESWRG